MSEEIEARRYLHLRDYLRVLRASWLIIVALTALAGAAAYALSKRQKPTYEATARVSYVDAAYELNLLGSSVTPTQTPPAQGLPARALQVTAPPVVAAVRRKLRGRAVSGGVSATVNQKTGLVDVIARSSDPRGAATLANTFATTAADYANSQARRSYGQAVTVLEQQLRRVIGASLEAGATRAGLIEQISRLAFLQRNSTPAQVTDLASPPAGAISPKPTRNALLAGLAGLVLGVIVAFLRDLLDRRLRGSREIQRYLDYTVLGRLRGEALGRELRDPATLRNGAAPDIEAFQIVRQNLEHLQPGRAPRSVLVTSAVPEEGKSTVAVLLAFAAAAVGSRTLLVECDVRRPTLAGRLGLAEAPGLAEYLAGTAAPSEVLQVFQLPSLAAPDAGSEEPVPHPASLTCLVAGAAANPPVELFESQRCREFLREVSAAYDVVILDSSPLLVVADTLALIPSVDSVLLCVRSAHTTRDQARAAKEALENLPPRPTGIVVTGLRARDEDDSYAYAYADALSLGAASA